MDHFDQVNVKSRLRRDIICISSIDWDTHWQIHQQIAQSLVAAGNRVMFVENTGVRTPRLSDARRVAARLARWGRTVSTGQPEIAPNVWLCSPLYSAACWIGAVLRGGHIYRDAEHERSAYG